MIRFIVNEIRVWLWMGSWIFGVAFLFPCLYNNYIFLHYTYITKYINYHNVTVFIEFYVTYKLWGYNGHYQNFPHFKIPHNYFGDVDAMFTGD